MPMNLKKSLFRCISLSAIILFALSTPTLAQDTLRSNKVITNTQILGIGAVNTLDTYLSPEEYTGTELRYISHSVRENGTKLSRELIHQAQLLSVHNRKENNNELGGFYNFQYNWQYDHNLVVTSPISAPSLRQVLTLDFTVRHTTFRVGYLGDYQQAKINQLRQHVWSNLLVLGIVRKFSINKFIP